MTGLYFCLARFNPGYASDLDLLIANSFHDKFLTQKNRQTTYTLLLIYTWMICYAYTMRKNLPKTLDQLIFW